MNGVAVAEETVSTVFYVYWRWDDEPDMKPEYLGTGVAGNSLRVPFELKGRDIRLFLVSQTEDGQRSVANITEAEQVVFSAPARAFSGEEVIEAGESLNPFDLINIYNDSGAKAQKADAADPTKAAGAFVVEAASAGGGLAPGESVRLFFGGNIIETTGRTPGAVQYLSETPGGMTETPPTGSGKIVQVIGRSISATKVIFEPSEPIVLV